MDVSVAIIQPRRSATADRSILTPHDYDVVVLDEPSTSYNVPKPEDLQVLPLSIPPIHIWIRSAVMGKDRRLRFTVQTIRGK